MAEASEHSEKVWTVGPEAAGLRLDVFLARQPVIGSRSRSRRCVDALAVQVDGRTRKPGHVLESGQQVRVDLSVLEEAEREEGARLPGWSASPRLEVLFEDPYILVIDKQVGLAAHRPHADQPSREPNIAELAQAHCGGELTTAAGEDRPGIVHRLDRDTSGVMLLAKADEASHFLRAQFKARTTKKVYRAICYGEPRFDSDHIDRPMATHPRLGDRMAVVAEGGKPAQTFYEVVERFRGFADFRCMPRTGRTHQIRVHMTSIGHSLVGDRVYRARNRSGNELPAEAPDPGRQCLHAQTLGIRHPRTHEELTFHAELPEDMQRLLRWLREHRKG